MPRFYPFKIPIGDQTYSGEWTLLMGYRVCVRARGHVSETDDIGPHETPGAAVVRVLERMVKAEQQRRAEEIARQQRELAKFSRPRRTRSRAKRDNDQHP